MSLPSSSKNSPASSITQSKIAKDMTAIDLNKNFAMQLLINQIDDSNTNYLKKNGCPNLLIGLHKDSMYYKSKFLKRNPSCQDASASNR
jgi:hypothetical protein